MLEAHRRDRLIEWMKEILNHGFVLDAPQTYADSFLFFEELIEEHLSNPLNSRLKSFIPTIGKFHTKLALRDAWHKYGKYNFFFLLCTLFLIDMLIERYFTMLYYTIILYFFHFKDSKYAVSQRRHINPSFNELRHILNLAQVMSIGESLSLISFDGDQTLYTDGGNFEENEELSKG